MALQTEFSMFNGKFTPETITEWLAIKEHGPIPPKNQQSSPEIPPEHELMRTHFGLFEFIRGVILNPAEYGLDGPYPERDYMFRLLGPFFFPGLDKRDLVIDIEKTVKDHIEDWSKKRAEKFLGLLSEYDTNVKPWENKNMGSMMLTPPTLIPEFQTISWKFQNYAIEGAKGKPLNPKYMNRNCARILRNITMPIPGRDGPIDPDPHLMDLSTSEPH